MKRRSGIQIMGKLIGLSPDARYGSGDSARCHRISLCDLSHRTGRSWNPADYGNMAGSFSDDIVCLPCSDRSTAWNSALWRAGMQSLYCV